MPTDKMRIGVGRFPVRTVTEATQMVDKVIGYMNGASGIRIAWHGNNRHLNVRVLLLHRWFNLRRCGKSRSRKHEQQAESTKG